MTCRVVSIRPDWDGFRDAARPLLIESVPPSSIIWSEAHHEAAQLGLLAGEEGPAPGLVADATVKVPRAFLDVAESAACHREPAPWPWLYRLLWRISRGEREILDDAADPDVSAVLSMDRAVRRDAHKMTAFVRFRSVNDADGERFIAWFEPRHRIVRRTTPFFVRRFPSMRWSILTPDECVHWDGENLSFAHGVDRRQAPRDDDLESFWLTYYAHTFNPARVRFSAMRAEMPIHYWRNLPEAASINGMLRGAPGRVREMIDRAAPLRATGGIPLSIGGVRLPAIVEARKSGHDAVEVRPGSPRDPDSRRQHREPPATLRPIRTAGIRIGVAGWDYPDWAGRVYPEGREGIDRLRWVAARFDLIEVNSTFYRPASERASRGWLERVADLSDMRFSAKLSRVFTHERELWKEAEVAAVRRGMDPLMEASRLVSLVAQFPWSFRDSPEARRQLGRIAAAFSEYPLHIEVRHASWQLSPIYDWLRERGVGVVNVDQPLFPDSIEPEARVTSRVGYVRLHGRNVENWFRSDAGRDERYDYDYSPTELSPWVRRVREMAAREDVEEVDVIFNNHYRGQAVNNAEWFAAALTRMTDSGADTRRSSLNADAA